MSKEQIYKAHNGCSCSHLERTDRLRVLKVGETLAACKVWECPVCGFEFTYDFVKRVKWVESCDSLEPAALVSVYPDGYAQIHYDDGLIEFPPLDELVILDDVDQEAEAS